MSGNHNVLQGADGWTFFVVKDYWSRPKKFGKIFPAQPTG